METEKTYQEREREYLLKVLSDADKEWYRIKKVVAGNVVPKYQEHIADAILASGFGYKKTEDKKC